MLLTLLDKDNYLVITYKEAIVKKGEQLDPYNLEFQYDFNFNIDQDILTLLIGSFYISTYIGTRVKKASQVVEVMGINPLFLIYKELIRRLGKYKNIITIYIIRNL